MKAIMVMYDSLNRAMLGPYGCDWTLTPNFRRLAERTVTFDNCYVCSLPCMPARRELHTGRCNFLHRSWGPLEPFDDSMPELLKRAGVYTHLVSDHQHYWEDGGATYHTRYSSWEISRGQEGDPWKAELGYRYDKSTSVFSNPGRIVPEPCSAVIQDAVNRRYMDSEEKTSQAVTFAAGAEFIRKNHSEDNWFLQLETFDPHEPFYTLEADRALYPHSFTGDAAAECDWPPYSRSEEDEQTVNHVRCNYAALVTKCDRYLGKVLDLMDEYDLWRDTMLIVNTDHGFLLGEHGWWGKTVMPVYDEIAHIPLFIYDPRQPECAGERRKSIVQTVDLAPTLLEYFGVNIPQDMRGQPLRDTIACDARIRDTAVFGYHTSQLDITDGRYVYMLSAAHPEEPTYEYTLMPTHMRRMFSPDELKNAELSGPFDFTKGCRVLKVPTADFMGDTTSFGTMLFDLEADPKQECPYRDSAQELYFRQKLREFLIDNDAPLELYKRFDL